MLSIKRPSTLGYAPTIAIVDSDTATVDFLTALLLDEGYQVIAYEKEANVCHALKHDQPALIVLDVRLAPPENGWETIERLRHDPATTAIPVIACTADRELLQQHVD